MNHSGDTSVNLLCFLLKREKEKRNVRFVPTFCLDTDRLHVSSRETSINACVINFSFCHLYGFASRRKHETETPRHGEISALKCRGRGA